MRWWNDEHMGIYTPSTHTGGLSENGMHWWNDGHMGIMHPCNAPNLRPFCRGVLPLFRHIALTDRRSLKIIEIQRVLLRFNKDAAASPPSSQTYPIETGSPGTEQHQVA